jgi:hypothetical protein
MKNFFFTTFLLLLITRNLFSQDCMIDSNPTSPVQGIQFEKSVNYKNYIIFYSLAEVKDSLLIRIEHEDIYRRVVQLGDSCIIKMKNNQSIKLINIQRGIPKPFVQKFIIDVDMYAFAFTSWISKEDVKILSSDLLQDIIFYSKIEEEYQDTKDSKHKRKYTNYTDLPKNNMATVIYKRNLRQLAKCALEL